MSDDAAAESWRNSALVDSLRSRIAALEAEVDARIVERNGWMEAAAKSDTEKVAAVQAERERCAALAETAVEGLVEAMDLEEEGDVMGKLIDRIKNGDPKP